MKAYYIYFTITIALIGINKSTTMKGERKFSTRLAANRFTDSVKCNSAVSIYAVKAVFHDGSSYIISKSKF